MSNTKIVLNRQSDLILNSAQIVEPTGIVKGDLPELVEDLANLTAADSTELARAEAAEASIKDAVDQNAKFTDDAITTLDTAYKAADSTELARAEAAEAAIQADVDQNEADADAAMSTELARAESTEASLGVAFAAADSTELARAEAAEASIVTAYIAADAANSSSFAVRMATEEARVDAILLSSDADKDSFAEIVTLINSVDTENDEAFAAYVLSNNAALSTQVAKEASYEVANDATLAAQVSKEASYEVANDAVVAALQADVDQNEADADAAEASLAAAFAAADSTEKARALTAEDVIKVAFAAADSTELARAEAAEASIKDAMEAADSTEKARAEAAEAGIQADVDQNEADADAAMSTELARAEAAEASIQADVDQNEADADAAITALQADVDQNEADADAAMSTELARAEAAEASIKDAMEAADSTEKARAEAAEAGIQAAFAAADSTELARAEAAEKLLQSDIDRNEADADAAVASIEIAFAAADTALSSSFGARMTTEEARVDAILDASDADKDSFAEIVTLINSVDTENDEAFAAYVLSNNAALSTEVARAGSAEASVKATMEAADSTEKARAEAAEAALQSDIDQNEANADAAVAKLNEKVSNEFDSAKEARENIQTAFAAADSTEKARAEAAEAHLEGQLRAEAEARIQGDELLSSKVDDIISNTDITAIDSFTEVELAVNNAIANTIQNVYAKRNQAEGKIDGENAVFTLAAAMLRESEQVFLNGVLQDQENDYTVRDRELIMVTAPSSGDLLEVFGVSGAIYSMNGRKSDVGEEREGDFVHGEDNFPLNPLFQSPSLLNPDGTVTGPVEYDENPFGLSKVTSSTSTSPAEEGEG